MIYIPFISLIIFLTLCGMYPIHALEQIPIMNRDTRYPVPNILEQPFLYHKKRFSLFYRSRRQQS
jgi:hypothetical protein